MIPRIPIPEIFTILISRNHHFHRFTAIPVHQVVSTNGYLIDLFGDFDTGKAAGERLLIDMGMGKGYGCPEPFRQGP